MLKLLKNPLLFLVMILTLTSCSTTFMGTVLVLTFRDLVLYVMISFIISIVIGLMSDNRKKAFWLWFILNLMITPLSGFVYLLIKFTGSNKT